MQRVLTVGVFDYFHLGHLRLFEKARMHGDYLIVAIQDDQYIKKYKPDVQTFYNIEQRMELIRALRTVDEVVIYRDVDKIVKEIGFEVFAVGEDQNHSGFKAAIKYCETHGIEVVHMKRTAGISSTSIKRALDIDL